MIPVQQQIRFLEGKIKKLEQSKSLLKNHKMQNILTDCEIVHLSELLYFMKLVCNDQSLHPRRCEACGEIYIPKVDKKNVCDDKCRVRLCRMRKKEADND